MIAAELKYPNSKSNHLHYKGAMVRWDENAKPKHRQAWPLEYNALHEGMSKQLIQ